MTALLNNRYRILKTLGRGGFGETYLTEDTHMPSRRKCVLKQLKPIVKQPKTPLWMKERFQREAAILEELGDGHKQIPQLYAYFSEKDKFYLVQEWIEGLTLDQYWSEEGNLHRDQVRQILLQLLPVLEYVHSRHIIHRDIKPDNIILHQGDNLPFLIDFGAVKEAIATEINHNSDSIYSASIGTPGYMSSEQAAGRPIYSSDLYSLGLTAIFLLTGKSPHELETDPRNGEIIWREHAFNLDDDLGAILDRATRFHPRDRFSTVQEMLAALKQEVAVGAVSHGTNATGMTLNVSPQRLSNEHQKLDNGRNTFAYESKPHKKRQKRSILTTVGLFLLIAMGVAAGTFATGFAIIANLLRSPESPQQAQVETPTGQPDLFPTTTEAEAREEAAAREEAQQVANRNQARKKELARIAKEAKLAQEKAEAEAKEAETEKPPKTLAKVDLESEAEINIPILTTGTSESQLVSTLGQPNREKAGWQPNSKELVYYNVIPDQVNLSYHSDKTGKIRQTDITLDTAVSLGTMQQTLTKMLGGDAPAGIKDKLRQVYNRKTNLRSFEANGLKGFIKRDSRDRVYISVWEKGFQ